MKYYHLKSIFASGKTPIAPTAPSTSFYVPSGQIKPYIQPTFQKVIFETERPTVILVSAVGATGKTALAENLARDIELPLLDLSKHKPVGDKTLTGLLTDAFDVSQIGAVFAGLAAGTLGVVVDGIDEGRSKTTDKAFEAFLDDIAKLCKGAPNTTFVLLGRSQILDDCWGQLTEKNVPTSLITISPFTITKAKEYIDTFTGVGTNPPATYAPARDGILGKLGSAFSGSETKTSDDFLSFIGYPPVLDAIVTLLTEERNYHKLLQTLGSGEGQGVEVSILHRIAEYILKRERDQKVIPNIVTPLLEDADPATKQHALTRAFTPAEQSARLVGHCNGKQLTLSVIGDRTLDERYEERLHSFLPEHPFLTGRTFRNAVFEAYALASLITSGGHESLLNDYLAHRKHSYHLVYMLDLLAPDHCIHMSGLAPLFTAAMEFRSVHSDVEIRVNGPDWEDDTEGQSQGELDVEIEILLEEDSKSKTFAFHADIDAQSTLSLGARVAGAFVSVPCAVRLGGSQELELTAPLEINARSISMDARALIVKAPHSGSPQPEVVLIAGRMETAVETISTNGVPLNFALSDTTGICYPAVQYTRQLAPTSSDNVLLQKYFRLKRILMEFRSHKKGNLAKYKHKIEHERVLRNEMGRAILRKLIHDQILSLEGSMYFLDADALARQAGVSWQDLRNGHMPAALETYLRSI